MGNGAGTTGELGNYGNKENGNTHAWYGIELLS